MRHVDAALARLTAWGAWLVLPVSLLLFVQWPLRDLVRAHSREANDLGQVLFAVYVVIAVTAATRRGTHLAMDLAARRYGPSARQRLRRLAIVLGLLPWCGFVLITGEPLFRSSLLQVERFSDTGNPGYVVVKLAAAALALAWALQGVLDLARAAHPGEP